MSRYPLQVEAELSIDVEGSRCRVHASGTTIFVDVPDLHAAAGLLKAGASYGSLRKTLTALGRLLDELGLNVEVRERGTSLARLGRGARSRLLALLGLRHLRVLSPRALLLAGRLS